MKLNPLILLITLTISSLHNFNLIAQSSPPSGIYMEPCIDDMLLPGDTVLPQGYQPICTDPALIKYVKINIHFMSPGLVEREVKDCVGSTTFKYLGLGNFTPYSNGI